MIRLIAAVDQKLGIAKHGFQPWNIPDDERYFAEQTMKHGAVVLMGKVTFEVIGHPLPKRRNIVLSSAGDIPGVETATDLEILNTLSDVWIIGGASVFAQTISRADELYLTQIEADFGCDQFFPGLDGFELKSKSDPKTENGFTFSYMVLRRL